MGCIQSKKDFADINPNHYRVVNVDDDGNPQWSAIIEITPSDLILHRRDKDTVWPLQCLRRYGHDSGVFTFEAGRRCATGEGIYAFRCNRADDLFHKLQGHIQRCSNADDFSVALEALSQERRHQQNQMVRSNSQALSVNSQSGYIIGDVTRPTSQNMNLSPTNSGVQPIFDPDEESNYLEPINSRTGTASRLQISSRLNSLGSAPLSPDPHSPGSPNSFNNILEVTTLNPLPNNHQGVSNIYQEFPLREYNNNSTGKRLSLDIPPQDPAPGLKIGAGNSRFLATQMSANSGNSIHSGSSKDASSPLSPNYHGGDVFDESHAYMNVPVGEQPYQNVIPSKVAEDLMNLQQQNRMSRISSSYSIDPNRCYENLDADNLRTLFKKNRASKPDIFGKPEVGTIDRSVPNTPTSQLGLSRTVNYTILDLNQSQSLNGSNVSGGSLGSTNSATSPGTPTVNTPNSIAQSSLFAINGGPLVTQNSIIIKTDVNPIPVNPSESPRKETQDYATIDFHKTVALQNSTAAVEMENVGPRKTRHNSTVVSSIRQSSSVSD